MAFQREAITEMIYLADEDFGKDFVYDNAMCTTLAVNDATYRCRRQSDIRMSATAVASH